MTAISNKDRSIEQHRRFFSVVAAAHDQWPESHKFQPDSAEHLRAWLLIKAGHRVMADFCLGDVTEDYVQAIPAIAFAMFRKHIWAWQAGDSIRVCAAKSIAIYGKDKVGHLEFCALNNAVDDVIKAETGLDPERLLEERERAA